MSAAAIQLENIITKIRTITGTESLNKIQGSIASNTAEAVYITLVQGPEYLADYFEYRGKSEFLSKMNMRCLTTQMVECFFGFLVRWRSLT